MNISGEMEIEILHGNNLAVAATGGAALNAKRRALARLTNAGENLLAEMRAERLAQADGCGRLSLTEGRRRDGSDDNIFPVGTILQAITDREMNLGLALAVQFDLVRKNARFFGDLFDRDGRRGLRDLNVGRHPREQALQLVRHSFSLPAASGVIY